MIIAIIHTAGKLQILHMGDSIHGVSEAKIWGRGFPDSIDTLEIVK